MLRGYNNMYKISNESHKVWENLKPSDDFIFAKLMQNEEICKELIEVLLDISIDHIEYLEEQKTIDISLDSRSVRLDVYLKDETGTVYNVEIQPSVSKELAGRSRYYQALIDLNNLEKGQRFRDLPNSYVIFICTYEPFGDGQMCYRYENRNMDRPEERLGDGTFKYFFNTKAYDGNMPEAMNVLKFIETGEEGNRPTGLAVKMATEYQQIKSNKEWKVTYMTLYEREQERLEAAIEKGFADGRDAGKAESRAELLNTVKTMSADGIPIDYLKKLMKLSEEEVAYVLKA